MTRALPFWSNFTAGELSPRLGARTDLSWWGAGLRELTNMAVLPHGGVTRLPGTRFVAAAKDASDGAVVLLPFEFSDVQAYVLELGDLYVRFYRDGGRIESGGSPVEVVTPWAIADLPLLQFAQSADTLYLVHPDHAPRKLTRTSHTSWTLSTVDWQDGPYLDENTTATTLTLSGTSGSVTVTASGATGINGGQGFLATDVGRLIRWHDGSAFTWLKITARASATSITATVMGATAGATTATTRWRLGLWSDTDGWPRAITFHQERLALGGAGAAPNRFDLTAVADFETFTPGSDNDDAIDFTIGADEVTAIRWMASQRVLLVGTLGPVFRVSAAQVNGPVTPADISATPEAGYASAAARPVRADRAVLYETRAGTKLRELSYSFEADGWLASDITRRAEHLYSPGIRQVAYQQEPWSLLWTARDDGRGVVQTYVREEQVYGAAGLVPPGTDAAIESVCVIPATGGGDDEVWLAVARTVDGATVRLIEQVQPFLPDGALVEDAWYVAAGLSYDGRSNPAFAITFGALTGSDVIASAPGAAFAGAAAGDKIVTGGTVADGKPTGEGRATITQVTSSSQVRVRIDKALTALSWAAGDWQLRDMVSTVSGLDHLEGETVAILGDGAAQPQRVVAGGAVDVDPPAAVVIAGLPYTSRLRTQRLDVPLREGSMQGSLHRMASAVFRLFRSAGFRAGGTAARLDPVKLRDSADPMGEPLPLVTGDRRMQLSGEWSDAAELIVEMTAPLPLTVLGIRAEAEVNP